MTKKKARELCQEIKAKGLSGYISVFGGASLVRVRPYDFGLTHNAPYWGVLIEEGIPWEQEGKPAYREFHTHQFTRVQDVKKWIKENCIAK